MISIIERIHGSAALSGLAQNETEPLVTLDQLPGYVFTPGGARRVAALLNKLASQADKLDAGYEQEETTEPEPDDECIHGIPLYGYFCEDCRKRKASL